MPGSVLPILAEYFMSKYSLCCSVLQQYCSGLFEQDWAQWVLPWGSFHIFSPITPLVPLNAATCFGGSSVDSFGVGWWGDKAEFVSGPRGVDSTHTVQGASIYKKKPANSKPNAKRLVMIG